MIACESHTPDGAASDMVHRSLAFVGLAVCAALAGIFVGRGISPITTEDVPPAAPVHARSLPAQESDAAVRDDTTQQVEEGPELEPEPDSEPELDSEVEWHKSVATHIRQHRPSGQTHRGTAVVTFTIDRSGRLIESRISASSGKEAVDRAALAMIRNASPYPEPPEDALGDEFPFSVPVDFR